MSSKAEFIISMLLILASIVLMSSIVAALSGAVLAISPAHYFPILDCRGSLLPLVSLL